MTIVEPAALAGYLLSPEQSATSSSTVASYKRSILDPGFDVAPEIIMSVLAARNVDWREAVDLYLANINSWVHVVHPVILAGKIQAIPKGEGPKDSDLALLLLCMHIVTLYADAARSQETDGREMLDNAVYVVAKRLFGLRRSFTTPNYTLIQCCILLSIFEFGHGDFTRAYISVGDACTMAKYLNIRAGKYDEADQHDPIDPEAEEQRSIYWSLFVLDRCVGISVSS
jgi:hypothetical protein